MNQFVCGFNGDMLNCPLIARGEFYQYSPEVSCIYPTEENDVGKIDLSTLKTRRVPIEEVRD